MAVVFGASEVIGLPNIFLLVLNENVGALTTAGSLLLVLKLNLPNCAVFVPVDDKCVSDVGSAFGAAFDALVFVNELNENVELVTDDDDVVVSFDKLLLGT